jgi:C4-dicarboxylate-specific signal transduction histidine kinase
MSTIRLTRWPSPRAVLAYGVAILSVTVALGAAALFERLLHTAPSVSLFLCAIMFVAWYGGLGPSVLAVVLATIYFTLFTVEQTGAIAIAGRDVPRVVLFILTAAFVIFLSATQRRNAQELARVNKALLAEIAQRRRAEAYLDEAQALSSTGSFGWKPASNEVFFSKECHRLLEIDLGRGPNLDEVMRRVHPDDRPVVQAVRDKAADDPNRDYEIRWLAISGATKYLHVRVHRVRLQSGEEELVGAIMDVSETRRAQEALHATEVALAHAARVATLGEMSASIAHEVNQPLAGIVTNGAAGLRWLDRTQPDLDEVRAAIERMIRDAKRASEVVQRLRALARKAPAERRPIDLNDVVTDSIALLQREIQNRRVVLKMELASGLPAVVADRIELQQVVINLMVNAMQAMERVTERPRLLTVRTTREKDQALLAVQDAGVGLDSASLARLFNPFFTTRPEGLGLGLSICRSIVEAHGGRIWASTNDGSGATFQFALPLRAETGA